MAISNGESGSSVRAKLNVSLALTDAITASASELNILDGATLSTTELNYVDGVTSAIQTQLNAKAAISGQAFTGSITATNLSGTNTGDNAVNSLYSGLAASKQDTLESGTNIKSVNGSSILGSGDLTVTDSSKLPLSGGTLSGVLETNSRISPSTNYGSDLGSSSKQFNALYVYDINLYNGKLRLSESSNVGYIDGNSGIRLRTNGGNTYFFMKSTGIINLVLPTSSAGLSSGDLWKNGTSVDII